MLDEMPETIKGGMQSEEVLKFSPFVSILMIDYLKTKYQNKPDDTIKQYIEYILADANTYTTVTTTNNGGFHRSISQSLLSSDKMTELFGRKETHEEQIKPGITAIANINESLKKARSGETNAVVTPSSTISVSPEELINRCDAVIVKLEKQCDGTHVMMLIQKMLELINKRLNNE